MTKQVRRTIHHDKTSKRLHTSQPSPSRRMFLSLCSPSLLSDRLLCLCNRSIDLQHPEKRKKQAPPRGIRVAPRVPLGQLAVLCNLGLNSTNTGRFRAYRLGKLLATGALLAHGVVRAPGCPAL